MVGIKLDGYEPYELTLTRKTSGWVIGNILFGGWVWLQTRLQAAYIS